MFDCSGDVISIHEHVGCSTLRFSCRARKIRGAMRRWARFDLSTVRVGLSWGYADDRDLSATNRWTSV